jgi:hypothetical protein
VVVHSLCIRRSRCITVSGENCRTEKITFLLER